MGKKYFFLLWTLFLFSGYFLYFSPLSLYYINKKLELIEELEKKNQILENHNSTFISENLDLEKKSYFTEMGYSEKNQIIVEIELPPISSFSHRPNPPLPLPVEDNNFLLSSLIFFFFFSLFIIIFFMFYYKKN